MKKLKSRYLSAVAMVVAGLGSCTVGPRFSPPAVDMPSAYLYDSSAYHTGEGVNIDWWENFGDPQLSGLIRRALENNRNLLIAASNVEQARLQLRQTRASLGPSFGAGASAGYGYPNSTLALLPDGDRITQSYTIQPTVSWELDFFGKIRRSAEAAYAQWQATGADYRSAMLSLAAEVANTYFDLLQYDLSLRISEETYRSRRMAQNLIDSMVYYGMSSVVDLEQARSLTATAAAAIPEYERARTQAMLALNVLLGDNPTVIEVDGTRLLSELMPADIPAGLPVDLLDRRPDILVAYYQAEAATANVGVAVANRYPSVALTGAGGLVSGTLRGLFQGNPWAWSAGLSLAQPVFAFGQNKRAVEIAEQLDLQAVLTYEQTVITALSEVEGSLEGISTYRDQAARYRELLQSARITQELTQELYRNGLNTYLDVLDADRTLFSTQLDYAGILAAQLSQYVSLYKALGGGW